MARRTWLFKSEPETFSIQDLAKSPRKTTAWDGVRNYQARNLLRDEMAVGDGVLFYHSSCDPPAAVGTAEVVRAGYPDETQFDARSGHYDPDARRDEPRWYMVDIRLVEIFPHPVPLEVLRRTPGLEKMALLRKGMRLSVQPVSADEWKIVLRLGAGGAPGPARRS